jgi:succinate dehydrogenase / fumarate reductase cytochrome b subunit
MALTGLFLISFLAVHVGLNACIFNDLSFFNANDNGSMFNRAAFFMGNSIVIRILEIGLFAGIILHIVQGYAIEMKNRSRRKQGYQVALGNRGSKWYSRSMAILGTLIFIYLIVHIAQFWVPSRITGQGLTEYLPDNHTVQVHNVYALMYDVFQQEWVVILYLLGVGALAFHLFHGFHSAFRSMGVNNKKYLKLLQAIGYGYTTIVCLLFALMPISMYFQWVSPYK